MIASQEWAGKLRLVFGWGLFCLLKLMIILFTGAQPTFPEAHPPPQLLPLSDRGSGLQGFGLALCWLFEWVCVPF